MRTWDGIPITLETFDYTPAELVELGIASVREISTDYLETRVTVEGTSCPNPNCDGVDQLTMAELDTRWRFCPSCQTFWTIDILLGLVYIAVTADVTA